MKAIKGIFDFSIKFPMATITIWLIAFVLLISQAKPFKMLITINGLINENFETAKSYRNLKENFEDGTPLLLLHEKGLTRNFVCPLRAWLTDVPKREDHLTRSFSLFSLRKPFLEIPAPNPDPNKDEFPKLIFPELLSIDCEKTTVFNIDGILSSPWNGIILNSKSQSFLTELRFHDLEEKNFESQVIPEIIKKLRAEFPPHLSQKTWWLGEAAYQFFMKEGLKVNNALNLLLLLIVLILLKVFMGTWRSGFIFIGTLLFSATCLFTMMAATETPLDVLNNSLFILLSVASLGDFIFICHYQIRHQCNWQESFRALLIPSFFTSLTTFLGFLSLVTSDLDIVKRLGLWAALSGVMEWLVLFSLLPALLAKRKSFESFSLSTPTRALSWLNRAENIHLSKAFIGIFFLIYLISPFCPALFNINDNPTMLFPKNHEFYRGIDSLKKQMGFSGEISLLLERSIDLDIDLVEMEKLTQALAKHPNVIKIETPKDLISFTSDGFDPDIKVLIHNNLKNTPAYKKLVHESALRSKIYLSKTSLKDIDEMRIFVEKEICKTSPCSLSGALVAYAEFSQTVPKTLLTSLGTSLFMVALVLILLGRKNPNVALKPLLISGFWGVAFILVLLAVTQFKLNFVTCVVLAILVGMTGDNAIHYLLGGEKILDGIEDKQGASVLTTTIMSLCCVVFFFFSFQPPRVLGILLILGLWGSLAGDLWFLKALIKKGRN